MQTLCKNQPTNQPKKKDATFQQIVYLLDLDKNAWAHSFGKRPAPKPMTGTVSIHSQRAQRQGSMAEEKKQSTVLQAGGSYGSREEG